ncbi:hypothetical protein [Paenibacillus hamazuiensis]|uniref:hypothetical protein n=1 Tax=Paenibacillus hamazuiensis TaxID=2936508 RepID=UPI00200EC359|nr:hypothetical protein [Paenibacillus hamazuiensis]
MKNKEQLEQEIYEKLTEGEWSAMDPEFSARHMLNPKYEARVQASVDPIVEETKRIRKVAREVDDRYDEYMSRVKDGQ